MPAEITISLPENLTLQEAKSLFKKVENVIGQKTTSVKTEGDIFIGSSYDPDNGGRIEVGLRFKF